MRVRKRPVVVDAVQINANVQTDGHRFRGEPFSEWTHWIQEAISFGNLKGCYEPDGHETVWDIHTPEGVMKGHHGDWIVRGIRGELYIVRGDIFADTYDPVTVESVAA